MHWTINNAKIDYEHASIMQMLDSAARLGRSASREEIDAIIKRVREYTVVHFVDEEFIFTRQYSMPEEYVQFHKREHELIQNEMLEHIGNTNLDEPDQVEKLMLTIRDRITDHIREVDAQMNAYIPATGSGSSGHATSRSSRL